MRKMVENDMEILPVWNLETYGQDVLNATGKPLEHIRFLDMKNPPDLMSNDFPPSGSTNFYRRDDVSATAYFYLDSPTNNLPPIATLDARLMDMKEKVWDKLLE